MACPKGDPGCMRLRRHFESCSRVWTVAKNLETKALALVVEEYWGSGFFFMEVGRV